MTFTKINTEGHISLNGYEYDSQYDRIIDNEVFEEARHYCGENFVENMKDDLYEGFEPICKGDDGNIYTVAFWGDRPVMWQRLKEKVDSKGTFSELTDSEREELLGLDEVDRSARDHHREQLIEDLNDTTFCGTDKPRIAMIMKRIKNYDDAYELACELVNIRTYDNICVELPNDDIIYEYDGADAYVEAAQIEFAHNLVDNRSATDEELLELFKN